MRKHEDQLEEGDDRGNQDKNHKSSQQSRTVHAKMLSVIHGTYFCNKPAKQAGAAPFSQARNTKVGGTLLM